MYCRNCGAQMNDNQAICIKCGVKAGEGKSFCSNCGKPVNENADICLSCGVAIRKGNNNKKMNKAINNAKSTNCGGNMIACYINAFENYFNYNGRTSRREYWLFVLCNFIVSFVIGFIGANILGTLVPIYIYELFVMFPSLFIATRRLHDVNKSGWLLLLTLTCVGAIPVLIWLCTAGDAGNNNYGSEN